MFNGVIVGHVEGIITAHNDFVGAVLRYKIFKLVTGKDDAVDPDLLKIRRWLFGQRRFAIFARSPCVIDPACRVEDR